MKPPALSDFARRLRREWRLLNLPTENETIVVAVSGGADSTALLAALRELNERQKLALKIIVAHFNHRLRRAESDEDEKFVRDLARKFDFEFVCGEWNREGKISSENLEQAARNARYDFLSETAENYGAFGVFAAHTVNDQAETFLLRLIRGSGLDGLAAMKPATNDFPKSAICNPQFAIRLIRPLLNWATREMTETYCRSRGIEFRNDSMNDDVNFARVRVRCELLPLLATYNPQIINQLAQTAGLIGEDADELNAAAKNLLDAVQQDSALDAKVLKKNSAALRRRVVRLWLENRRSSLKRVAAKHLKGIDDLLMKSAGNSVIELPGFGIVVKRSNRLIFESIELKKELCASKIKPDEARS